jgi:hypothetical protein
MLRAALAYVFGSRRTEDTNSSDTNTTAVIEAPSNPLDEFNKKLESDKSSLNTLFLEWQASLTKLVGDDVVHKAHLHPVQCDLDKSQAVATVFEEFKHTVKQCFQSPGANLQTQLDEEFGVKGHIQALEQHINDLCEEAHQSGISEDELRGIKIHISHASLAMITELQKLSDGFANEIWLTLTVEQREEELIKIGFNLLLGVLLSFIGQATRSIDFNCHERFKRIFNATIANQEIGYGVGFAEARGILVHAHEVVEDYVGVLRRSGGSVSISAEQAPKDEVVENDVDATPQLRTL